MRGWPSRSNNSSGNSNCSNNSNNSGSGSSNSSSSSSSSKRLEVRMKTAWGSWRFSGKAGVWPAMALTCAMVFVAPVYAEPGAEGSTVAPAGSASQREPAGSAPQGERAGSASQVKPAGSAPQGEPAGSASQGEPTASDIATLSADEAMSSACKLFRDNRWADAIPFLRRGVELGDVRALGCLSELYLGGKEGVSRDEAEAFRLCALAANQGDGHAMQCLGAFYACGCGVKRDYATATSWMERAAAKGRAVASQWMKDYQTCQTSSVYVAGHGAAAECPPEYVERIVYPHLQDAYAALRADPKADIVPFLRQAAAEGSVAAQRRLGTFLIAGQMVPANFEEGIKLLAGAAERGDSLSLYVCGRFALLGKVPFLDTKRGEEMLVRAGQQGYPAAQLELAKYFMFVKEAYGEAERWALPAAQAGSAEAQSMMGMLCLRRAKPDFAGAAQWYRAAAEQGDGLAMQSLGALYACGRGVERDYDKATQWMERGAAKGASDAQRWMEDLQSTASATTGENGKVVVYVQGHGQARACPPKYVDKFVYVDWDDALGLLGEGKFKEAMPLLEKAGLLGSAQASYFLALCYVEEQDYAQAFHWHQVAAELGLPDSQLELSKCLLEGTGCERNLSEGLRWLQRAADQGMPEAQYNLGCSYYNGVYSEVNYGEAVRWWTLAYERGNLEAGDNLAVCLLDGQGTAADPAKALAYMRSCADKGSPTSQFNLACEYCSGKNIPQDYAEAARWFRKAAEQGDETAQFNLGTMYLLGQGVPRDDIQRAHWYRLAAEQGHTIAQNSLAVCYYTGRGVKRDYAEALKWVRTAAEAGNLLAIVNMGVFYETGRGVAKDYTEAVRWYSRAAQEGVVEAWGSLGDCYYYGRGVVQSFQRAFELYTLAADEKMSAAQNNLAIMYARGEYISRDYAKAFALFRASADQNCAEGIYNLGIMYDEGWGVAQDTEEADRLYERARQTEGWESIPGNELEVTPDAAGESASGTVDGLLAWNADDGGAVQLGNVWDAISKGRIHRKFRHASCSRLLAERRPALSLNVVQNGGSQKGNEAPKESKPSSAPPASGSGSKPGARRP